MTSHIEITDPIANGKLFIKKMIDDQYLIWNITDRKVPKLKPGLSWSSATLDDIRPTLDLNSNFFGMRTGFQPNGKFIIGLDFDMWIKKGDKYDECKATRDLYKTFEALNPLNIGVFVSSTQCNRGVLVDITNCPDLIKLIDTDSRRKIQQKGFCLEILTAFNFVLPPSKTQCKIEKRFATNRSFLNNDHKYNILELTNDNPVSKFIYSYIYESREVKTLSQNNIKIYEKHINYSLLKESIENNELPTNEVEDLKPFLILLDKERISNYSNWMKIGLALKNIYNTNDTKGFEMFDYFSSLDSKSYNQSSVKYNWNIWNAYKERYPGLNHNYILSLSHRDNPTNFCKIFRAINEAKKQAIYIAKKTRFEQEVKYILHPPVYMSFNKYTKKWLQYNASDLYDIYKIKYGKEFISEYLSDENVNYYDCIDFIPDKQFKPDDTDLKVYNSFEGFYIDNLISSDKELKIVDCKIIINHINYICNENKNTFAFFTQWLAHLFFNTKKRCGIVPVIQGPQKAGKGTLYELVAKILGKNYCLMTSTPENDVFTRFNDSLHEKILVNINEAEYRSFATTMENFKSLITDSTFNMETKNQRRIELKNYLWFIITTNNDRLFNVAADDRRFYFITTSSVIRDKRYFDELYTAIDNKDIIYSFYKYLETQYKPDYNFSEQRIICKTEYQTLLESVSKQPFYLFLNDLIESDTADSNTDICIKPKKLIEKYIAYCRDNRIANNETGTSIKMKLLRITGVRYYKFVVEEEYTYYYRLKKIDIVKYLTDSKLI